MRCPTLALLPPPPAGKTGWPWTVETPQLPDVALDGNPWPRITIVTPSYNQGHFVEETIRSILLQGYPNLEYIIMDGASTDDSMDVIMRYQSWISSITCAPDKGQSDALNNGLNASTGTLLGWINSDDVLTQGSLHQLAECAADKLDENVLFAGTSEYRDAHGLNVLYDVSNIPLSVDQLFEYPNYVYLAQPSVFFTHNTWIKAGVLDEKLHYAMDLDLWIRMAKISRIRKVDAKLSWMRQHADAKTWRDEKKVIREVENVLRSHAEAVNSNVFSKAMRSCQMRLGAALVRSSLYTVRMGKRLEALTELKQALSANAQIIFDRTFIGVAFRIAAPQFIQRLVLTQP